MNMKKYVYKFAKGQSEGGSEMKNLLGGKGANLGEMCRLMINVPPGFTVSTDACVEYFNTNGNWPEGLSEEISDNLKWLEELMKRKFGSPENPLLLSVRSGARVSMPGMMDTVLNLGMNDVTAKAIARQTSDERFAYDAYRRFIAMYGDVVLGLKPEKGEEDPFEAILSFVKKRNSRKFDTELAPAELKEIIRLFKDEIRKRKGIDFPEDPLVQLREAIGAVLKSWMNPRAIEYRKLYNYPSTWGTAVNVQSMVFGNMGETSGTGVVFTRDPATGAKLPYGEFLMNAQGEDVVAGIRTPQHLQELRNVMPENYNELIRILSTLENHFRDMQDVEFTIEKGTLYILQTRSGKRTGFASIKIAVDMVQEGLIDEATALKRLEADQLTQLLRPIFDSDAKTSAGREGRLLAKGLNAGPGAAYGRICLFADEVEKQKKTWKDVILVRQETSPEDIRGMENANGVLTARGGMTSHAALVARQRGKVCVVGCSAIDVDYHSRCIRVKGRVMKEGEYISIDGSTGEVFEGKIMTKPSEVNEVLVSRTLDPAVSEIYRSFEKLLQWADKYRRLRIRTNADRPSEAEAAVSFGAEGIGLCRTEHMFFEKDRIKSMRKMILSRTPDERKKALNELLPLQRTDFEGIFRAMKGKPVTVRTLDPPLHEFLPQKEEEIMQLADELHVSVENIKMRIQELHEANPMLGHRGCRLGITQPEITEMQATAIFKAACAVKKEGTDVHPEVMIPLVGNIKEFRNQEKIVRDAAQQVMKEEGVTIPYLVGTMIELPGAAVCADEIADGAEFFSFGTNDLTQTTLGISRDDYGKFIDAYMEYGIYSSDPFITLEQGVRKLVVMATEKGRKTREGLKVGICGEHGGDPASVEFCHSAGLDYVSCSPFRVPVARLAAAIAALKEKK
jgi:pyruvate,orthophosphate dikinase